MILPTDPIEPAQASAPASGNLVDVRPPATPQQREADFSKPFVWRNKEIIFSVASESYYRDFRVLVNAPPLWAYRTNADFTPEASRVLYCSSHTAKEIRGLRLLPAEVQIERFDQWVEANIAINELDAAAELAVEINNAVHRARTKPLEAEGDELDGMGN